MQRAFTLEYWTDEGWYVGRLQEVPGVMSPADTLEELQENIRDAYHLLLEDDELPVPDEAEEIEVLV
ncbi:MAG TPA: type II toxin-antitoxin system HicB family antitoxin [Thermoanaerobaculia bacterium]|nr:type II toxin-antitoxin system HicB family antitoxin [Thermoanaerobaculia bacterium]